MLTIVNEYGRIPVSKKEFERAFAACCSAVGERAAATLQIAGDRRIRELNRGYRGKDAPTDVLSFAAREGDELPGAEDHYIGEVILGYPQIARQAKVYGNTVAHECIMLFVHGTLHLFGYDHISDPDYARMHAQEKKIMKKLGYDRS